MKYVGTLAYHIRIKVTNILFQFCFVSNAEALVCITSEILCSMYQHECFNIHVNIHGGWSLA